MSAPETGRPIATARVEITFPHGGTESYTGRLAALEATFGWPGDTGGWSTRLVWHGEPDITRKRAQQ